MTLALDVDVIKHSLGRWDEDPSASGLHARRLSLTLAEGHLSAGYDVVLGQYLARTPFIEDLAALAQRLDVRFFEFVLDLDAPTLAARLALRASDPPRTTGGNSPEIRTDGVPHGRVPIRTGSASDKERRRANVNNTSRRSRGLTGSGTSTGALDHHCSTGLTRHPAWWGKACRLHHPQSVGSRLAKVGQRATCSRRSVGSPT